MVAVLDFMLLCATCEKEGDGDSASIARQALMGFFFLETVGNDCWKTGPAGQGHRVGFFPTPNQLSVCVSGLFC